jgi:pyruvate dehydrogenase E1 component alpha subunit
VRDLYRQDEEVDEWRKRDPIDIHKEVLLSQGIATQAEIDEIEQQTMDQIDAAVEFARQSPYPEASALFEDMYANPIALE